MNLENVYQKIQDNNIDLYEHNIQGIKGIVIEKNKQYSIFLNHKEIENSDDEFMVVVHEYGHCMTGSTHLLYSSPCVISKHEHKADRKAVLDFLPIDRIKSAIEHGCRTAYEFSEYLDIPEQFIVKAFQHYNAMDLIKK